MKSKGEKMIRNTRKGSGRRLNNTLNGEQTYKICRWLDANKTNKDYLKVGYEKIAEIVSSELGFKITTWNIQSMAKFTETQEWYRSRELTKSASRDDAALLQLYIDALTACPTAIVEIIDCLGTLASPNLIKSKDVIISRMRRHNDEYNKQLNIV